MERKGETRIPRSGAAPLRVLSELVGLIPAVLCTVVSTSYVLRAEQADALLIQQKHNDVRSFILSTQPPTPHPQKKTPSSII